MRARQTNGEYMRRARARALINQAATTLGVMVNQHMRHARGVRVAVIAVAAAAGTNGTANAGHRRRVVIVVVDAVETSHSG